MVTRAVIFDRDGVLTYFDYSPALDLFRSLPYLALDDVRCLWDAWCREHGPPRSAEAERVFMTGFWDSLCERWSFDDSVRDRLRGFDYTRAIRPFADARPALLAARARGLRVGVLSNFPLATIEASLGAAGLADLVDVALAAPVIGAAKPAAAAYLCALDALGVAPGECVFVDDEPECVEGARAVGIRAYLLDRSTAPQGGPGVVPDLYSFQEVWT